MRWYKILLAWCFLITITGCSATEQTAETLAIKHFNQGNQKMQLFHYKAALSEYQASLNYDPQQPVVYYNVGLAYYSIKLFERAVTAYEKAIHMKPDFAEAWYNLSLALYQVGRTEDAYSASRKYKALNQKVIQNPMMDLKK